MKSVRFFYWIVLVLLVSAISARAQLNFSFSFQGNTADNSLSLTGTVTGEIIGLTDNATSVPTDIIITSAPAQLGLSQLPYDLAANGWSLSLATGLNAPVTGFTVQGGVITSANYLTLYNNNIADAFGLGDPFNVLSLGQPSSSTFIVNDEGLTGATYSPLVSGTAPEPTAGSLIFGALLVLFAFRRRFSPAA